MKKSNLVKIAILTIVTVGLLDGCSSKSDVPVTGQENIGVSSDGSTNRAEAIATGTVVGGGIGVVIGETTNKPTWWSALWGAMIGAVLGDVVHKTSQSAATNEHAYAEAEKTNNQNSDELNKASNEMESTMDSSDK